MLLTNPTPNPQSTPTADHLHRQVVDSTWDLIPCRWCGSPAQLWQRRGEGDVWFSFVSCTNEEYIDGEACMFFTPPEEDFYCARKATAVAYWNRVMGLAPLKPGPIASRVFALTAELRRYFEDGTLDQSTTLYDLLKDIETLRVRVVPQGAG
jgi:hypothetical protein